MKENQTAKRKLRIDELNMITGGTDGSTVPSHDELPWLSDEEYAAFVEYWKQEQQTINYPAKFGRGRL